MNRKFRTPDYDATLQAMASLDEVLLALLFYGHATGVFSSRKIEEAAHEHLASRYVASGLHPDHDTIAHLRSVTVDVSPRSRPK